MRGVGGGRAKFFTELDAPVVNLVEKKCCIIEQCKTKKKMVIPYVQQFNLNNYNFSVNMVSLVIKYKKKILLLKASCNKMIFVICLDS